MAKRSKKEIKNSSPVVPLLRERDLSRRLREERSRLRLLDRDLDLLLFRFLLRSFERDRERFRRFSFLLDDFSRSLSSSSVDVLKSDDVPYAECIIPGGNAGDIEAEEKTIFNR